jgi:N-acetylmuramoyl-L-alanine amidase
VKMLDSTKLNKTIVTFVVCFLSMFVFQQAFAQALLSKVRVGQDQDKTRVVFDVSDFQDHSVFSLSNPPRIVIDFKNTKSNLTFSAQHLSDPRINKIRVSEKNSKTRVVLDTPKNLKYRKLVLNSAKNKQATHRLVIDLLDPNKHKNLKKQNSTIPDKTTRQSAKNSLTPNSIQNDFTIKHSGVSKKEFVVALDAGHGGRDSGAVGAGKVYEKHATLMLAKALKKEIDRIPGMRAVLTRKDDRYISLGKRVKIAKQLGADIFISIHADAFHDKSVRGGSVYVLSERGASSTMARLLARSENASLEDMELKAFDKDVAFALSDLSREANIKASRKLAQHVLKKMRSQVKMHKRTVQSARFAVLKSIDMPSLLIETAFISNPREAKNLMSRQWQKRMAKAIASGLEYYRSQTAPKLQPRNGRYVHYKVQRGDTLSEIAAAYQVSANDLKKLNGIKNANQLFVGKKIKIPYKPKHLVEG